MTNPLLSIEIEGRQPDYRGKVREIFDLGDRLLLVATDRLSAFDCILPTGIPGKGAVLTGISRFWFQALEGVLPTHFLSTEVADYPAPFHRHAERLAARSMLVKKARRLDIEAVVRGYLAGSGWKDYRRDGAVCGVSLPAGLKEADRLPEPIFTPAAKNDTGHDENIPLARMIEIVGEARAEEVRRTSLALYRNMAAWSESRGVILADTKFEFGLVDDRLTLIDEVGTPDSSRYWDAALYRPGQSPPSFDKQFVRDWLERSGWNKEPPAPALPADVVAKTMERYQEAARRLTGARTPLHFSEARWNWT